MIMLCESVGPVEVPPVVGVSVPHSTGARLYARRYMFETCYTFRGKSGEKLMKLPGQIDGCVVLHMHNLPCRKSIVVFGLVGGE